MIMDNQTVRHTGLSAINSFTPALLRLNLTQLQPDRRQILGVVHHLEGIDVPLRQHRQQSSS